MDDYYRVEHHEFENDGEGPESPYYGLPYHIFWIVTPTGKPVCSFECYGDDIEATRREAEEEAARYNAGRNLHADFIAWMKSRGFGVHATHDDSWIVTRAAGRNV
jgi:hypothetical protein